MKRRPLFSTYSQGENRVTGSIIAAFERLDVSTLTRLLEIVTEDSSMELMTFEVVRPEGPGSVPDARISARFKYLFEVKTEYSVLNGDQLQGHLDHLKDRDGDERLFAVSPDMQEPDVIREIGNPQLSWFNFAALSGAMDKVLEDSRDPVADHERFLLRELQTLFEQEGLLGRHDTVVVAARLAYDFYLRHSAYVCQAHRSFRPVGRLGFYRDKRIEPLIPTVIAHRDDVVFGDDFVQSLLMTGDGDSVHLARVITDSLKEGSRVEGAVHQVFLLSSPQDAQTVKLGSPIEHTDQAAWTMGQRYAFASELAEARITSDLGRTA